MFKNFIVLAAFIISGELLAQGPIPSELPTTVFNGKCETTAGPRMGLLLLENVGGKHHYYIHMDAYHPDMDKGWNPRQYTGVEVLQEISGGYHLLKEQEMYTSENYSYNKLNVETPNSWHHTYITYNDDNTVTVNGTKGGSPYSCQMKPNIKRATTPEEQGVPVSFGTDLCEVMFSCHEDAKESMLDYHKAASLDLELIKDRPLFGECRFNNGRSRASFQTKKFTVVRLEKKDDFLYLNKKFIQGPKTNPYTEMELAELDETLNKSSKDASPLLTLDTFSFTMSNGQNTWLRSTETELLFLGSWHGQMYTCRVGL